MPIYIYVIGPYLKPKPEILSSKTITIKLSEGLEFDDPVINYEFEDLSGWKIEKGNANVTSSDYFLGEKSFYITSNKEFIISQKLNKNIINCIKDKKILFSFWFKPKNTSVDGSLNYAWAEIKYRDGSDVISVFGVKVYPRESNWYYAFVVAYIPRSSEEVIVAIHGNSIGNKGFNGYVDTATLGIWEDLKATTNKGQISLGTIIHRCKDYTWHDLFMGLGFFVRSLKPDTYIIRSLRIEVKIQNPNDDAAFLFEIIQANDKNLDVDNIKVMGEEAALYSCILASLDDAMNVTIRVENFTSDIRFSLFDGEYFRDFNFYGVKLDKKFFQRGYPIGGYAEWKYPSSWSKKSSKYVTTVLGGINEIFSTISDTPQNITISLIVNWGEIVSHNTLLGEYYSIRNTGLETITFTIIVVE